jgi:hypothetical protein
VVLRARLRAAPAGQYYDEQLDDGQGQQWAGQEGQEEGQEEGQAGAAADGEDDGEGPTSLTISLDKLPLEQRPTKLGGCQAGRQAFAAALLRCWAGRRAASRP